MSTEPTTNEKTHTLEGLSRLSLFYLRTALNDRGWQSADAALDDMLRGCDALRAIPRVFIPKELVRDEDVLQWGDEMTWPPFQVTDAVRDTCRTALKHAFKARLFQVNEHAAALIHKFSLKS